MAQKIYQATLMLKNDLGQSTSEPYYCAGEDLTHQQALAALVILKDLRKSLFGHGISIRGLRVSDVSITRDAMVEYYSSTNGKNTNPNMAATEYADVIHNRLLLRCFSGFSKWGWKFLAGIPDDVCKRGGDMDLLPSNVPWWTDQLNVFRDHLANPNNSPRWGIYGIEKLNPPSPKRRIASMVVNADMSVTLTTSVDHGFIAGDRVKLHGGSLLPILRNGFYKVMGAPHPVTGTTFTVEPAIIDVPALESGLGFATKSNLVFSPYGLTNPVAPLWGKAIVPVRFTSRKGARPFDQQAGRRRAR